MYKYNIQVQDPLDIGLMHIQYSIGSCRLYRVKSQYKAILFARFVQELPYPILHCRDIECRVLIHITGLMTRLQNA